jgi:hypothetical protein
MWGMFRRVTLGSENFAQNVSVEFTPDAPSFFKNKGERGVFRANSTDVPWEGGDSIFFSRKFPKRVTTFVVF